MPLHIDIRINDTLLRRLHIARMTKNGMTPDSINEYSVVVSGEESLVRNGRIVKGFKNSAEWWEWEVSEIRFYHRYGDDELTLLMLAVQAVKTYNADQKESILNG